MMNNEIKITSDLLKLKKLLRELQQVSYGARKIEERYPEIEFSPPKDMIEYIKVGLAFRYQLKEIVEKLNYFKKYE